MFPSQRYSKLAVGHQASHNGVQICQDFVERSILSLHLRQGVNAVPVEIDTAANILKSVGLPEPAEQSKPEVAAEEPAPIPGVPMTVNPADIPKLLQDTDKLKAMMEQRNKQIDQGY